jgi:hypothetical protein
VIPEKIVADELHEWLAARPVSPEEFMAWAAPGRFADEIRLMIDSASAVLIGKGWPDPRLQLAMRPDGGQVDPATVTVERMVRDRLALHEWGARHIVKVAAPLSDDWFLASVINDALDLLRAGPDLAAEKAFHLGRIVQQMRERRLLPEVRVGRKSLIGSRKGRRALKTAMAPGQVKILALMVKIVESGGTVKAAAEAAAEAFGKTEGACRRLWYRKKDARAALREK